MKIFRFWDDAEKIWGKNKIKKSLIMIFFFFLKEFLSRALHLFVTKSFSIFHVRNKNSYALNNLVFFDNDIYSCLPMQLRRSTILLRFHYNLSGYKAENREIRPPEKEEEEEGEGEELFPFSFSQVK